MGLLDFLRGAAEADDEDEITERWNKLSDEERNDIWKGKDADATAKKLFEDDEED